MADKYSDKRNFAPSAKAPQHGPKRHALSKEQSERQFSRSASKTHYKNLPSRFPMRGGIRF